MLRRVAELAPLGDAESGMPIKLHAEAFTIVIRIDHLTN